MVRYDGDQLVICLRTNTNPAELRWQLMEAISMNIKGQSMVNNPPAELSESNYWLMEIMIALMPGFDEIDKLKKISEI